MYRKYKQFIDFNGFREDGKERRAVEKVSNVKVESLVTHDTNNDLRTRRARHEDLAVLVNSGLFRNDEDQDLPMLVLYFHLYLHDTRHAVYLVESETNGEPVAMITYQLVSDGKTSLRTPRPSWARAPLLRLGDVSLLADHPNVTQILHSAVLKVGGIDMLSKESLKLCTRRMNMFSFKYTLFDSPTDQILPTTFNLGYTRAVQLIDQSNSFQKFFSDFVINYVITKNPSKHFRLASFVDMKEFFATSQVWVSVNRLEKGAYSEEFGLDDDSDLDIEALSYHGVLLVGSSYICDIFYFGDPEHFASHLSSHLGYLGSICEDREVVVNVHLHEEMTRDYVGERQFGEMGIVGVTWFTYLLTSEMELQMN